MTAIEFIKENYTVTNGGEDYMCNHSGQLVGAEDIAEEYHQAKLKLLGIGDVVISEAELCDNPNCEDGIVDYDYYKNPIYCQVCDKHN